MKKNGKRIVALVGVILLVGMIVATLVVACLKFEGSGEIFKGLLCCDIAIPILLWLYMYLYHRARKTDDELEKTYQKDKEKKQKAE